MKKYLWILGAVVLLATGCAGKTDMASDLQKTGSLELSYATQYAVDYYEKGYVHVHIEDGTDYVLIPENEEENTLGLSNPVYIHMPCDSIYLAASSAMDLFLQLEELDSICACSTKAEDYAMEEVQEAIRQEQIKYVGKYSAPDYEMLLSNHCGLAIESTMIGHSPKIKEQLEHVGIPVLVERSSYEPDPLGRLEWIKLYGVLTGNQEKATSFFEEQLNLVKEATATDNMETENEKITVAFFSITSQGTVTVRKPGDYICKMIELAGGTYALDDLLVEEENALSTVNIGMEDFYREAQDADILIYNGSIDKGVTTLDELLDKNALLSDFKAVQEGHVWSTSLNMFQETSKVAAVLVELSDLIHGVEKEGVYFTHLQ